MAAVLFLGEEFYLINALGLGVLIMGVFWFNYLKYKKVAAGEIKPSKSANLEPYKDEGAPDMVCCAYTSLFCFDIDLQQRKHEAKPFQGVCTAAGLTSL